MTWSALDAMAGSVCQVATQRPVFHLTFDDGPHPEVTPPILDVLDRYQAPATFFVLVDHAHRYPALLTETLRRGHEIGLHGRSHMRLSTGSWREIVDEVARGRAELQEITGRLIGLFRPPYGDHGLRSLAVARARGMKTILWSVDTRDWHGLRPDAPLLHLTERIAAGGIGLVHDTPVGKTAAEERARGLIGKDELTRTVLTQVQERGLQPVSLAELLVSGTEVRRFKPAD